MRVPLSLPLQMMFTAPLWPEGQHDALKRYMVNMRAVCQTPDRPPPARPSLFYHGPTRLWDYRPPQQEPQGRGVVFVPSLVNRCHILDLLPRCSMVGAFAEQAPTFLLDWGSPDQSEGDLAGYINDKMIPALQIAALQTGGPVHLVGYCMGGLLAIMAAVLVPHLVQSLTFLAVPWDFSPMASPQERAMIPALKAGCLALKHQRRCLPAGVLQGLFLLKDPFSHIARYTKDTDDRDKFLALEQWIQHGQPLTPDVALWAFSVCYEHNAFHHNTLTWGGQSLCFSRVRQRSLIVSPLRDTVVPPASALALKAALPHAHTLQPDTGHIGMIIGNRAPGEVWQPILDWIHQAS
ncbi:MAG: alpha/beta fold hydrolase [Alphaproteobacteria bacterium]